NRARRDQPDQRPAARVVEAQDLGSAADARPRRRQYLPGGLDWHHAARRDGDELSVGAGGSRARQCPVHPAARHRNRPLAVADPADPRCGPAGERDGQLDSLPGGVVGRSLTVRREPLPPAPSPKRRGGARLFAPSPLRGGGWGEGWIATLLSAVRWGNVIKGTLMSFLPARHQWRSTR